MTTRRTGTGTGTAGTGTGRTGSPRRELRVALLLVLVGSGLVLLSAGRDWVDVVVAQPAPLPARAVVRTGADVAGGLRALGVLGLAGVAALAATRALGRLLVGVLLSASGAGAVAVSASALARGALAGLGEQGRTLGAGGPDPAFSGWPLAALAGGALLAVGGLVVALRGRRWAQLSARYEAPAARAEGTARRPARPEVEAWEALDRGEDPTGGDPRSGPGTDRPSLGA